MEQQRRARRARSGNTLSIALVATLSSLGACNGSTQTREPSERPGPPTFPTTYSTVRTGSIATRTVSANTQILHVGCASCHSLREGEPLPESVDELEEFHGGLTFRHGELSCASCHNPNDVITLRLADGRILETTEVVSLCSQCHGTQARDYRKGAHGGMAGYWDLSRGPRKRKICSDCHDPHAPSYVGGLPVSGPRDRFQTRSPEATPASKPTPENPSVRKQNP